jgi:nickel-type superoxide dismutase maturation protease|tara:strand:+ start:2026 stop:2319 length:294 start_codon:yes stop_codon:yes gene_type:complete
MDSRILNVKIKGDSMWPTFNDGDIIGCEQYSGQIISVGDLVVFRHPFKNKVTCVKRVKSITEKGYFVEGDNPDPLASEDSHNFGPVSEDAIFAFKKE